MRAILRYGAAALAVALAGCGSGEGGEAANNATAAVEDGAASFCTFTEGDTRQWKAVAGAAADKEKAAPPALVVTGQARVWGQGTAPQLSRPDSQPPTLRLWLTKAQSAAPEPADGFYDLRFELPDTGAIQTVVIRCDGDTEIATIKVERASGG